MLYTNKKTDALAWLLLSIACLGGQAAAQPTPPPDTVTTRARPNLDPLGVRLGGFVLFPEFALEYLSDDNVFATNENRFSDNAYVFSPGVTLGSEWNRNDLTFGARASMSRFDELTTEDHDDSEVFIRGRWDTSNEGSFTGALNRSVDHEGRDSADDARGFERTEIVTERTTLGYEVQPGRMLFEAELDMATLDFGNVVGPGGPVNNDDRDRDVRTARLRVGYEVFDGYALFFEARDDTREYDSRFDDEGFERSSEGNEYVIGAALNVTEVIFGTVYVGRKSQTYDDARYAEIGGTAYGIDVGWNVTQLTTLTFSGRGQVAATTIVGASGIDETTLGLRADHELLRNLILSLDLSSGTDDFQGIDRRDDLQAATFGLRYLMNRKLEIAVEYTNRERESNAAADLNFSKRTISIQFKGQI